MSEKKEKLQKFIAAVNNEAEARASEILAEAENEKRRIISDAEKKGRMEAEQYLEEKRRNADKDFVREISRAELEMKRQVLLHRDELTNKLFAEIEKKLADYRKKPDYEKKLADMLSAVNIHGDTEIRLSPDDMKYADGLKKILKDSKSEFKADSTIKLGGLSIYFKDNGTILDNTFDLALEEQREKFTASNAFAQK